MSIFADVLSRSRPHLRDAAVHAAYELGLFDALGEETGAAALARRLGAGQRRLVALMDVLAFEGVLVRRPGAEDEPPSYGLGELPGRPAAPPEAGWGRLADVIAGDRPLAVEERAAPHLEAAYHRHLREVGAASAERVAQRWLAPAGRRLLDAGAGAGTYSAAFLAARPDGRATLVDRPSVLSLAAAALGRRGDRCAWLAGEIEEVALGEGQDVALLANVLHLHGPERGRRLCVRLVDCLRPGGRLVVVEVRVAADRSGPALGLYFSLNMALYTEAGGVYAPGELAEWMRAAGLLAVREADEQLGGDGVVLVGERRG